MELLFNNIKRSAYSFKTSCSAPVSAARTKVPEMLATELLAILIQKTVLLVYFNTSLAICICETILPEMLAIAK